MYFYNSFCCRTNLSAIGQLCANHVVRQSRCAVSEIHSFSLKHEYMIQIDNSFAMVGCMFEIEIVVQCHVCLVAEQTTRLAPDKAARTTAIKQK